MKKKIILIALSIIMAFCLFACEVSVNIESDNSGEDTISEEVSDGSWAVYWYLCGSDLETNYGCATNDLIEMLEVALPENVNVIIETGGANAARSDCGNQQRN